MPLDAVYLSALTRELRGTIIGTKIDKIYQVARDEVVLNLRGHGGSFRFLLSANPNSPRVGITAAQYENPATPPMFCMLLRKHISGGIFESVDQPAMERVLDFSIRCLDEFGEYVTNHLIIEIMGRNSNLILTASDGRIVDCVRRVDYEMSEQRQVLPGLFYHLPPAQAKKIPTALSLSEISGLLASISSPVRPDSFLLDTFSGLSPIICRELVHVYDPDLEDLSLLPLSERYTFAAYLHNEFQKLDQYNTAYLLEKNGSMWDFTYRPVTQYGALVSSVPFGSFSELLDTFYRRRDQAARLKSRSQDISRKVTSLRNRTTRKLQNQKKELAATDDRDKLRLYGELITANIYRIRKGMTKVRAENYYDPDLAEIEIPLSPRLSPQENAAKYFKDYNKAKNAIIYLTEQIEKGEQELEYLNSVLDAISRVESEKDIAEIREEMVEQGYLRSQDRKKKTGRKKQPSLPMEFVSSTGLRIRVGKNNMQNDQLTLRSSYKSDVWLHTQKIHGSHVIISCGGGTPDDTSLKEAAILAAYYSQARESQNVPVDYTIVKNVRKPNGAKPGMVIYDHYNTLYVTPDPNLPARLLPQT